MKQAIRPKDILPKKKIRQVQESLQMFLDIKTQLIDDNAIKETLNTINSTLNFPLHKNVSEFNKILKELGKSILWHINSGKRI